MHHRSYAVAVAFFYPSGSLISCLCRVVILRGTWAPQSRGRPGRPIDCLLRMSQIRSLPVQPSVRVPGTVRAVSPFTRRGRDAPTLEPMAASCLPHHTDGLGHSSGRAYRCSGQKYRRSVRRSDHCRCCPPGPYVGRRGLCTTISRFARRALHFPGAATYACSVAVGLSRSGLTYRRLTAPGEFGGRCRRPTGRITGLALRKGSVPPVCELVPTA